MKCPFCKEDRDRVVDSRASADGFAIRRRRECLACGRRYTTYERIEESPIRVIKKDGAREPFERRKILAGLMMVNVESTSASSVNSRCALAINWCAEPSSRS